MTNMSKISNIVNGIDSLSLTEKLALKNLFSEKYALNHEAISIEGDVNLDKINNIVSEIEEMSISGLKDLRSSLIEKYNIPLEMFVSTSSAAAGDADEGGNSFSVILKGVDEDKKTAAMKLFRDKLGLQLTDAKKMVEEAIAMKKSGGSGTEIKNGIPKADAEKLMSELKEISDVIIRAS